MLNEDSFNPFCCLLGTHVHRYLSCDSLSLQLKSLTSKKNSAFATPFRISDLATHQLGVRSILFQQIPKRLRSQRKARPKSCPFGSYYSFALTTFPLHAILFVPSRPQSDVNSRADCSGLQSTVREGSSVSRHPPGPIAHEGTGSKREGGGDLHLCVCVLCSYVKEGARGNVRALRGNKLQVPSRNKG